MRVRYSAHADLDLKEAITWYLEVGVADQFASRIQGVLDRVEVFPESGQIVEGDVRSVVASPFPYRVVYRVEGETMWVLAVFHCDQDPKRLRDRLTNP